MSFFLNYQGSKWTESKHLAELDFSSYENIIEPFGGSFGFSRYLYEKLKLTDKKYFIYDNNKELIDFYNYIKKRIVEDTIDNFLSVHNSIAEDLIERFKTGKDKSQVNLKDTEKYIKENISEEGGMKYIRFMLLHNLKSNHISRIYIKKRINKGFLQLMKKAEFIFQPFDNLDLRGYDKDKSLIYLDPPYILEDNSYYKSVDETFSYYEKLVNLFKTNICLFVHSYNGLLDYVFKDYTFMTYDKTYRNKGNKKIHSVYYNPETPKIEENRIIYEKIIKEIKETGEIKPSIIKLIRETEFWF